MHATAPSVFPDRPLKVTRISKGLGVLTALGLFTLLIFIGLIWWSLHLGKGIYADWKIAQDHHVLPQAQISGECRSLQWVFTNCKASIEHQGRQWHKSFVFFELGGKEWPVQAIASNRDPSQLTLDLAAHKALNRSLLAGFFALVGLICLAAGLIILFVSIPRQRKVLAALNRPEAQPWQLVPVPTINNGAVYLADIDGQPRKIILTFGKNKPWVLGGTRKKPLLLGIAPKNGGTPVPLDTQLGAIDGLSPEEKAHIIRRLHNQEGAA